MVLRAPMCSCKNVYGSVCLCAEHSVASTMPSSIQGSSQSPRHLCVGACDRQEVLASTKAEKNTIKDLGQTRPAKGTGKEEANKERYRAKENLLGPVARPFSCKAFPSHCRKWFNVAVAPSRFRLVRLLGACFGRRLGQRAPCCQTI